MLNNHSFFSLGYGVLSPEQWVDCAEAQKLAVLALTDINSTAGVLDTMRRAQEKGLRVLPGVDFRNGTDQVAVALPLHAEGFAEINRFLSQHLHRGEPLPARLSLSGAAVIYPFRGQAPFALGPHEFLGVAPEDFNRLRFSPWLKQSEKLIALQAQTFRHQRDFNTHRLLRATADNVLLSRLAAQAKPKQRLYSPAQWEAAYQDYPQLLRRARRLLEEAAVSFTFKDYTRSLNRRSYTDSPAGDRELIRSLCAEGLTYRYGSAVPHTIRERLENELAVIEKRGFYSYFLINWDIVRYARRKNFFYVGRGSGANSLVAYLLRITDVDPVELDLYFERFINLSRRQPPDFDVDFSWRDRPELTAYIFKRFPRAALLGSHTTFQFRAIARELGKVLGLPGRDIEDIGRQRQHSALDERQQLVLKYGKLIENFPHRMTVHASGILIPEREIYHYGATWLPPKGFPTTHFDMYSAEDIGLYKFDILGQRGLGKIKDALALVRKNYPDAPPIDVHNPRPFYRDEKIRKLLRAGRTMACFYVESPAMRGLLKKLRCDNYLTLVAASSIIRPGVSQSGMMAEYIKRYREPERRQYIHPKIGEILGETFGVMVYQEDVLKVAHYFAGLSLEEADVLRRGMSWKFRERNEFDTVKDKFFQNCQAQGYSDAVTAEVWRQIESFGNYAFAKGHSASYAVESYQSLYLKAHYPLEYLTATVNNGGGFYRAETYLNEARLHGGVVEPPCVNRSAWETRLYGQTLVLGFQHLKDLESETVEALLRAREEEGPFSDLSDFLNRVAISLNQLILLIRVRAFRQSGQSKQALLWEAHFRMGEHKKSQPVPDLFRGEDPPLQLPELERSELSDAVDEIELLGFPLCSPFDLVPNLPEGVSLARELPQKVGQTARLCGYLIHVKRLSTRGKNPQPMMFGTFLDQEGGFIDTVHFAVATKKYPFQGKGIYLIEGRVMEEYDFVSVEVARQERLPYYNFEDL